VSLVKEIERRRTFAIISHPDAGKTTLTEKLLLFGGAIHVAGAVKSNKIRKTATSDFMEIERQRGISVATSVMGFDYKALRINLLDTPGHKDFAEDTFRTLTAVDSVIVVIDSAKGVESQTIKLMEVCRMRQTPVLVFVNKLDREGRDPIELLDEIEQTLQIDVRPMSWPIGMGATFKGVYNLHENSLHLFRPMRQTVAEDGISVRDLSDPLLDNHLGGQAIRLRKDVELLEGVYTTFDTERYLEGSLAPVFFGSALNNFGVRELLDTFVAIAPSPRQRYADQRVVSPYEEGFSGFVFKIHANLDPRHRDRIAFLRVCSGRFDRNKFYHHVRQGKSLRFRTPASFMAQEKTLIEEAYPGDVIGLYDTGNFKIGDTLTEGEAIMFKGIPSFSPEIFRQVVNIDPMKSKQLESGIRQLSDEGVAQLFIQEYGNRRIIGTVGALQFDVIQYRLEHEYGALCRFEPLPFYKAAWITAKDSRELEAFCKYKSDRLAQDKDGNLVFFAESNWNLQRAIEDNPKIIFSFSSEFMQIPLTV